MMSSLFTRLSTSLAAVCMCTGFAFLAGCDDCDDDCEKAHEVSCCEGGSTVHEVEYLPAEESSFESRQQFDGDRSFDTSAERMDRTERWSASDMNMRRERLVEIEREKVLYPDRAAQLDAEAAQINRELNINVNVDRNMDRSFEQRQFDHNRDVNVNVRDHSDLNQPAARENNVKQDVNVNVDRATPPASDIKTESRSDIKAQDSSLNQDASIKTDSDLKSDAEFKSDSAVKSEAELKADSAVKTDAELKADSAVKSDADFKADSAVKSDVEKPAAAAQQDAANADASINTDSSVKSDNLNTEVKKESEFKSETSAPDSDLNQNTELKKETETKVDAADGELKTETKTEQKSETNY